MCCSIELFIGDLRKKNAEQNFPFFFGQARGSRKLPIGDQSVPQGAFSKCPGEVWSRAEQVAGPTLKPPQRNAEAHLKKKLDFFLGGGGVHETAILAAGSRIT